MSSRSERRRVSRDPWPHVDEVIDAILLDQLGDSRHDTGEDIPPDLVELLLPVRPQDPLEVLAPLRSQVQLDGDDLAVLERQLAVRSPASGGLPRPGVALVP